MIAALLLDFCFGEPSKWHPLVGFGQWAGRCRTAWQQPLNATHSLQRLYGVLAWAVAVLPCIMVLGLLLMWLPSWLEWCVSVLVLYFTIGWQSLREHALAIAAPLMAKDLAQAQAAVARIVSRDTQSLDESGVAKAGMESVLENGSDAIFAPLFWFVMLGPIGALLYRLANTLDAMWGYKTDELRYFGWCAARIDDVLNYLPARLVVLTYGACGQFKQAWRCAKTQGSGWKSPNAGPVMAAGAGALNVQLGGAAVYFGEAQERPMLGCGEAPRAKDLERAVQLVDKGVLLWAVILCVLI